MLIKMHSTKRAADKWDSARFTGIFLALSFPRSSGRVYTHPLAANACRWVRVLSKPVLGAVDPAITGVIT